MSPSRVVTGLEAFLAAPPRRLAKARFGLLCNQASVDGRLRHARDLVAKAAGPRLAALFSPQHGIFDEQQDNMVESPHGRDPQLGIPVWSLYADVRRPTAEMLDGIDALLVDLQDVGCRVYTFITTLRYVLEDCARSGKSVWVLDRPNPAGRPVEGLSLRPGQESFVGAGTMPMRHGLTMGELAHWFVRTLHLDVDCRVIAMEGWRPEAGPGFGWPLHERSWVNPSPNAPSLSMARCYAGTVMLEGTTVQAAESASFSGYPPAEMLQQLKERLLKPADCFPACADISRIELVALPDELSIMLEVHAAAAAAVPLPGDSKEWSPEQVFVEDKPAAGMRRDDDGILWVLVPQGTYRVTMKGKIPSVTAFQLQLPLKPQQGAVKAQGWDIQGISPDGQVASSLQLTRTGGTDGQQSAAASDIALAPFLSVERVLMLGLTWQVQTTVRRISPVGVPVVVSVPLLPGESVTTADIRVEKGRAAIALGVPQYLDESSGVHKMK